VTGTIATSKPARFRRYIISRSPIDHQIDLEIDLQIHTPPDLEIDRQLTTSPALQIYSTVAVLM
jgi:hypothetical protein